MARKPVIVYGVGGFDPSKPDNNIVERYEINVPDEQLAVDAAEAAIRQHVDPSQPDLSADDLQSALLTVVAGSLTAPPDPTDGDVDTH